MKPTLQTFIFGMVFLICGIPSVSSSQNFGGVPPGKSWLIKGNNQIDVIYNHGASAIADTVLSIVEWVNHKDPYSLGKRRENVKIVLRNENLTTNGFVGYVPFRSEFYLYGAQNPNILGYNDWIRLLTLHEYRHVIQYSNMRWGVSHIAREIFGDAAQAGIFNLLVPDWFSEGDAVFFESVVSGNGRGQLPAFSADFRALLMAGKKYSYWKYRNGSYKDLVPNEYVHGYMLTGYGYRNFSDTFWSDVLNQTSRLKGVILPFRKAIKRNSDHKLPDFHKAMMEEYQQYLYEQLDSTYHHKDQSLLPHTREIKNEIQILVDSSGQEYLLENSFDEISTIYQITGDKKKKLFSLGRTNDPYLVLKGSRFYFTNQEVNSRWTNREYGDIYYYDLSVHRVKRVTKGRKFLSVDYQPDTKRYLAVQAGKNGINTVVTFRHGETDVDTLLEDNGTYYSYPHWLDSHSDQIVFTGRKYGRMFLRRYDISNGHQEDLIPPTRETISRPSVTAEGIYFSSSHSGIDNIYYYDLQTRKTTPATFDRIGAYNPTLFSSDLDIGDSQKLYYSAKTAYGQRIRYHSINKNNTRKTNLQYVPEMKPLYVDRFTPELTMKSDHTDTIYHTAKIYKPSHHLIHFHSLYLDPSTTIPKLTLLSNDYLNTTKAGVYGRFFRSDRSFELGGEMTYAGWYPELFFNANHRMNRSLNIQIDNDIFELPKSETSVNAGLSVPLDFSRRQYSHLIRFTGRYGWTQEHFDPEDPILPGRINIEPRLFQNGLINVDWSLQRLKAYRDIFPKWGIMSTIIAKRSFSPGESWLLYARQGYNIPGLFKNDGFKIRWQIQHNSILAHNFLPDELLTTHDIQFDYETFRTGGLAALNYFFPLAYPEVTIPHIIYTKRISLNLFTEHFRSNTRSDTWSGIDLFLTARYLNLFDMTAGIRFSRNWNPGSEPYSWSAVFLRDL